MFCPLSTTHTLHQFFRSARAILGHATGIFLTFNTWKMLATKNKKKFDDKKRMKSRSVSNFIYMCVSVRIEGSYTTHFTHSSEKKKYLKITFVNFFFFLLLLLRARSKVPSWWYWRFSFCYYIFMLNYRSCNAHARQPGVQYFKKLFSTGLRMFFFCWCFFLLFVSPFWRKVE